MLSSVLYKKGAIKRECIGKTERHNRSDETLTIPRSGTVLPGHQAILEGIDWDVRSMVRSSYPGICPLTNAIVIQVPL